MKIPDDYITFDSFEEQQKKYREWGFKNRKKNELKTLYYKGTFTDHPVDDPEECEIIGYTNDIPDEMVIVIYLKSSKRKLTIDRRYLKQMQSNKFRLDQNEEPKNETTEDIEIATAKIKKEPETEQLSLFSV